MKTLNLKYLFPTRVCWMSHNLEIAFLFSTTDQISSQIYADDNKTKTIVRFKKKLDHVTLMKMR